MCACLDSNSLLWHSAYNLQSVGGGACAEVRPSNRTKSRHHKRRSMENSRCSAAEDGQNSESNLSFSSSQSSGSQRSRRVVDVLSEQSQKLDPNYRFEPTIK